MTGKLSLVLALVAGCELPPTVDTIDGTWTGALADADLDRGVELTDPSTTMTVDLYAVHDWGVAEQWADITLDGSMDFHGVDVDGGDADTTKDIFLEDTDLRAEPRLAGIKMKTRGEFSDDFVLLDLDMRLLGTVYLERVDEPEDDGGGSVGGGSALGG